MKEMVVTCDHCGKRLNDMQDYPDTEFMRDWLKADLCSKCLTEITDIIRQFVNKK